MPPQISQTEQEDERQSSLTEDAQTDNFDCSELPEVPYLTDGLVAESSNDIGPTKEILENKWAITGTIIPFSIAGVLIRIALQRLEMYEGAPVFGLVYAQWIGCLIMGIVVQNRVALFNWYQPLHAGISTGLCGSITTFSSWQLAIFEAFANYNAAPHTRGENVLAALSQLVVTLAMSLNGLLFGHHIGQYLDYLRKKNKTEEQRITVKACGFSARHLQAHDMMVIGFGFFCWVGVILAAIFSENQRELSLACAFAPCGALLRWYLSAFNTLRGSRFPFGTFSANIGGTIILAILTLISSGIPLLPIACQVIEGLRDGFCGCLTTVSTFVVELSNLQFRRSYFYGLLSIIIAQCFMFIILGSYIWTRGVYPTCT